MNVLVFGMTHNPGGMESAVMNYYKHIDKNIVHFDFLANETSIAYEDEIKNNGSKVFKITARSKNPKQYRVELRNFFENHASNYDAIWMNTCSLANIDYLKLAKKYGIKCRIIHCHNSQNGDSKLRNILHILNRRKISRYATTFWSCSDDSNEWFFGKRVLSRHKITMINNALDTKEFVFNEKLRDKYRKRIGAKDNLVVGHVGRFHFQKNHMFLLDIFCEILKEKPDALLVLVGRKDGDYDKVAGKIRALNIQDNVKILSDCSHDDISGLMCAFDVFLFPSLFEGFSVAMLEAQSTNLPVVASSDKIPQNIKLNDLFSFVPLDKPVSEWAKQVLKYDKIERTSDNSFMAKHGFDISIEAKNLIKMLEKGINK